MNWPVSPIAILLAALIPILIGFFWYSPLLFGKVWMKVADMSEEKVKSSNMFLILGLTLLFSFMMSFLLATMVVHQTHLFSLMADTDPAEAQAFLEATMSKYGGLYRSFGHGVLHGTIAGLFFVLPFIAVNALFERKSFAYIAIHTGYWMLCLALMGGLICAWV